MNIDGLVPIYKERGMTSRAICNRLQTLFGVKKVGHLGTLDPFASGILLCFIGRATKLIPYIDDSKKTYEATLKLGEETDTLDCDGVVTITQAPHLLDESHIKEVLSSFLGKSEQEIPLTSAKRVNGRHLYELAHKRETTSEKYYKEIEIYDISLLSYKDNEIQFRTTVSEGTYIRVLAHDIAIRLGEVGHLIQLIRVKQGEFLLSQCVKLEDVTISDVISIPHIPLSYEPVVIYDSQLVSKIRNGNLIPIHTLGVDCDKIMIVYQGDALALYKKQGDTYICERGLE
ncbi:MAG: tRNA pseudouridine(55) synthase TruB [Coprobacillus sp.]|nr:tRNA pseudouridine(55) synthase TruB [Coprobacillus sp.]